uniref:C-type lectin domain-containing protein n=1 Tax=Oryzias latipes TaxID=8090 RepID=A0A3P9IBR6_ORYLA
SAETQLLLRLLVLSELVFQRQLYEYIYVNKPETWEDARQYCIQHYTDLATVTNMTDMKRLREAAKNDVPNTGAWIGLHRPQPTNRKWHWSLPGLEFNETNWASGESGTNNEYCGAIRKDLTWVDHGCGANKPFICYNGTNTRFYFIKEVKTWFEAQRFCRDKHTDLVSGLQQLRDEKLKTIINLENQYFNDYTYVFIGLFNDAWEWSNGSSFSFRQWDENNDNDDHKYYCGAIRKDLKWVDHGCGRFYFIKEDRTWEEALYYCRHHHHDLVTITNMDEQRWVQEKTKNASSPFVWTGLRYTCSLGFWFWVSDEVVHYKNWASPGQVNECDMSGAMQTGGEHQWFKKHDEEKFNFFCSK